MITKVTISNFKSFGEQVSFELKPLTLLFGANSVGKSSMLQALHLTREVLVNHRFDIERREGDPSPDLGGFPQYVHQKDVRLAVTLRFDFEVGDTGLGEVSPHMDSAGGEETDCDIAITKMRKSVRSASVEIVLRWGRKAGQAYVAEYRVYIHGQLVGTVKSKNGSRFASLKLNRKHDILKVPPDSDLPKTCDLLHCAFGVDRGAEHAPSEDDFELWGQDDALPPLDRPPFVCQYEGRCSARLLSACLAGPANFLCRLLKPFRYIGPLRDHVPRNFQPPRQDDPSRWACGLGAWDILYGPHGAEIIPKMNEWLPGEARLGTGYRMQWREFASPPRRTAGIKLSARNAKRALRDQVLRRDVIFFREGASAPLHPGELGTGMSQLVPVVVAGLSPEELTVIEQPELHLHPKVQCAVGDLLIYAALGQGQRRQFVVETHSEHLILRVLRRIRETMRDRTDQGPSRTGRKASTSADAGITPNDLAVIHIAQGEGQSYVKPIPVDEGGEFSVQWPDDFFEQDFYERNA